MLRPKKSLGQHFLRDRNVLRKIAQAIDPQEGETIVEIGPGTGALTEMLAGRCRLIAVEIDGRALDHLKRTFGSSVDIVHGDIRDLDLRSIAGGGMVRVAGNIPYNITSDILFWAFEQRRVLTDATLMIQAEVAERLVASTRTKEYGILSVCSQTYAEPKKLFKVSRNSFSPPPEVDSTVVRLSLKEGPPDALDKTFRTLVRGLFGKRRKTIRNGLRFMGYGEEALIRAGAVLDLRPEVLAPQEFVSLAALLQDLPPEGEQPFNNRLS